MAANHKYLKNYYKSNNPLKQRLEVNQKIAFKLLCFLVCSIIYIAMLAFSQTNKLSGEVSSTQTIQYIQIVMTICYAFSIVGIICFFLKWITPSTFDNLLDKIPFKVKNVCFTIVDWGIIFPACAVIATFCFSYIFIITPIDGFSMSPTIDNNERVFVSYLSKIERFTVVIITVTPEDNFEVHENSHYIKRVIGLPGETVTWIDKKLYVNNVKVDESFFPPNHLEQIQYYLNFNGTFKYKKDRTAYETTIIPEGYYFVMGDNRNVNFQGGSKDSRQIGLIPEENMIGVAKYHMNFLIPGDKII